MVWGALAQSAPDFDFLASFWLPVSEDLLAHRGFTHSILFGLIIGLLFALLARYLHRPHNIPFRQFLLFFCMQILLHDMLDVCNAYGTGLLEPFSHKRFALNILYVADPLFSIWLGITTLVLIFIRKGHSARVKWVFGSLCLSGLYLAYASFNKVQVDREVKRSLALQGINYKDYFSTPTPFNSLLWYTAAAVDSGYYIGYRSVFDAKSAITTFTYFPKNNQLLEHIDEKTGVQYLVRFADNFYTVERWKDTTVFNVLRFGQIFGWQRPKEHFAFHYFLDTTYDNGLVVQRGRFKGWNKETLSFMLRRITGSIENAGKD